MIVSYIDKSIQVELEKRRKALARESNSPLEKGTGGTKQFNKYLSRTPYVVMASNLDTKWLNVAIAGGTHFNKDAYINKAGYKDDGLINYMHGFKNDGTGAYRNTKSKGISPIPGIKDISVEYKGGYKGIREATVNWAVSNLEDLEFYTPHFLAIGRSVALEWGWTMFDTPHTQKFITYGDSAIEVDNIIFTNPSKIIIAGDGNLDGMGGVVTNFNFKLRDDGGFDCTTTLNALGVNFFGGDGLDTSGEVGLGSILMDKDKITAVEKDISTEMFNELSDSDRTKMALPDANIIEELINLPRRIHLTLSDENLGEEEIIRYKANENTMAMASIRRSTENNQPFFRYWYRFKKAASSAKSDFMVRWGWLEDNVFSKYIAATGAGGGDVLFNFRSIDEDGNSIKIRYDEKLIPINPFRSMIYAESTAFKETDLDGGDLDLELGGEEGTGDHYFDRYSRYFVNYFKVPDNSPAIKFNESGYGKLRNIYVSLTDVLESFGFDSEYTKTLVDFDDGHNYFANTVGGGSAIEVRIGKDTTYYANSDKIDVPKTMEFAINKLLGKINRNFHNYWKFKIVSDTETMDNVRIIDENYVAPNPNEGPEQPIDYTTPDKTGIYKFPSFTVGSTVKSQTLEFKLPDAMKTVAMYGTNKIDEESLADPSMRKFKALGGINKNPFIKAGGKEGTHILSNLKRVSEHLSFKKYGNTHTSGSLKKGGNTLLGENEYKFVKIIEKTAKGESSTQALASQANPINNVVDGGIERRYYVIDVKANNILLKAEAITQVRSDLGISKEASKSYLIPAELGLEIDGIGGIKPGNICQTDYIQRIYNERTTADNGPNTFFQIFDITQKVSDDGWTTTLGTKMRLNGNALSGSLIGSFDLDMKFGTPVKKRQKAKTLSEVQAAIDLYNAVSADLMAEARAASVSVAELSRTDDEEMEGDLELDEIEFDDFSNLEKPPPPPEVPVTTAVTGTVEYEYSAEQNTILYKARPDLRWKNADGGWVVATKDVRKKAWDELHKRDEPESQADIVANVAKVETQTVVAEKSKEVKEQKNTDEPEFEGEPDDFD